MSDDVKALIAEAHGWETPAVVAQHAVSAHDTIRRLTVALEAAQQAPAVDRGQLLLVLAGDDCYEHDADSDGWVFSPGRAIDAIIASGILQDVAKVEARGLEKAADIADSIGHVNNNQHSHIAWEAAEAIRACAQQVREGN